MKTAQNNGQFPRESDESCGRGVSISSESGARLVSKSYRRAGSNYEAAFSLPELMVAVALCAVMAVSLYGGISFGFSNITLARQNLRATQIALEKMEIVRMYSWEQVNSNGFVPTTFTAPFFPTVGGGGDTNGGVVFYGKTVITNFNRSISYSNDIRKVQVTLNWTNRNVPQTLQMSTYISQYGMQRYIY
jgi:prepilin-type N-terminal cleavage/methylation domain-containing protein